MSTFTAPTAAAAATLARAANVNDLEAATAAGFDAIPDETLIKDGRVNFGTDTGSANTYVVALPYAPTAYNSGLTVSFIPLATNTGASTINVNGLGVKSIRDPVGSALAAGLIVVGVPTEAKYSSVTGYFHLTGALSPMGPAGPAGGITSVDVSGGTTGLTSSGGPITSSGTITLAGVLSAANGGTGVANNSAATTTRVGAYALTQTLTAPSSVTFPVTGTLATLGGTEILTNKTLTAPTINGGTIDAATFTTAVLTAPDINGGTADSLTALSLRNAGTGAYDATFAYSGTLTAARTVTWNLNDAARSVSLTGNLVLGGNFTTSGAYACTLTLTGATTVTLPTSGTLVAAGAITTSGLTQTTARLLGRTTASTGAVEEITVGAGLTLSAGSLTGTAVSVGDHAVIVHTGNGHGSTNNKIRRFTTAMVNTGTAITYADSAANGGSFTINADGIYAIVHLEGSAGSLGVSVNSAALTTSIDSIPIATVAAYGTGISQPITAVVRLVATDVVRAHTDGTQTDTGVGSTWFSIRKIAA